ncbi:hypothetical protein TNCV_1700181 [Trichonephila clavipes]|nr:hypothetical protein TNCV_1700181 [Trichonephila clavipes]
MIQYPEGLAREGQPLPRVPMTDICHNVDKEIEPQLRLNSNRPSLQAQEIWYQDQVVDSLLERPISLRETGNFFVHDTSVKQMYSDQEMSVFGVESLRGNAQTSMFFSCEVLTFKPFQIPSWMIMCDFMPWLYVMLFCYRKMM